MQECICQLFTSMYDKKSEIEIVFLVWMAIFVSALVLLIATSPYSSARI